MTLRERTPESKSSRREHRPAVLGDAFKKKEKNEPKLRQLLLGVVVGVVLLLGVACIVISCTPHHSVASKEDLALRHQIDLDRRVGQNETVGRISSSNEFSQQMARFNTDVVQESTFPHEIDCRHIALDPDAKGQTVKTLIDPPFLINIHEIHRDVVVSQEILDVGCYECSVMQPLVNALKDHPEASLLDIGSNIGQYSLQAAAINRTAYAFEPYKENWRRLCHSVNVNKFQGRGGGQIKLFNSALSNETMEVRLKVGHINKGATKVISYGRHESDDYQTLQSRRTVTANGVTLDDMNEFLPKGQVVLKIDVEGFECRALAGGLDKYLPQLDIVYVAIEWSHERLEECDRREEIFALFAKNELKPYIHVSKNVWMKKKPEMAMRTWRAKTSPSPNKELFDMAWSRSNPAGGEEGPRRAFVHQVSSIRRDSKMN